MMIITKVVDKYYAVQCVRDTFITIKKRMVVNGTTQSRNLYLVHRSQLGPLSDVRYFCCFHIKFYTLSNNFWQQTLIVNNCQQTN